MVTESRFSYAEGVADEIDLKDILGKIWFLSDDPSMMAACDCCCFTKTPATADN
jgi:hypothetical protein